MGSVRFLKPSNLKDRVHTGDLCFFYVLQGQARLKAELLGDHTLNIDDCCTLPNGARYALTSSADCELLEVALPAV
jgi:hypothetical protein